MSRMPNPLRLLRTALQLAALLLANRGKRLILLGSHVGKLTGNLLGLALAAQRSPDFFPVFLDPDPANQGIARQLGIATFYKNGRVGQLLWKRAEVLAFTAWCKFDLFPETPRGLKLALWHGMPIKGIGAFDIAKFDVITEAWDLTVATSEFTARIMANSFALPLERVLVTGEPKTDSLPGGIAAWEWLSSLRTRHRKIIAYFPTWREQWRDAAGNQHRSNDDRAMRELIGGLLGDAALRECLERENAALVIRMHPFSQSASLPIEPPFYRMDDSHGEASHLLAAADVLLGDYSSLVIDALLFEGPLALWCEDLEDYCQFRQLPYFDFLETFAWAVLRSRPELIAWMTARLQGVPVSPATTVGRARCASLFHAHAQGGAGDRILAALRERGEVPRG